jgi:subtilisin family serine protease
MQKWLSLVEPKSLGLRTRKRKQFTSRPLFLEGLESRQLMAMDMFQVTSQLAEPDELLVQFRSSTPSALIGQQYAGSTITRQLTEDGWYQVDVGANVPLTQALSAFQSRSDVIQATPDFKIQAQSMPNDPSFSSLWGLSNNGSLGGSTSADINIEPAWALGTTSTVVTAVIDSGIDYTHPDLAANIWINGNEVAGNGIDDDKNGYIDDIRGWDFANNDNNPMDDNGHGTHVAGTIGAVGNNGVGVVGVAWKTSIMALKFLDASGSGSLSSAISAINYARVNGAKVINASWGGGGFSSALQSAITQFVSSGGIFVAAAGNESSNNVTTPSYPANYAGVISVGASTRTDLLAGFSNFGTNVDIVAPGQSILSTLPNNSYGTLSGTSMASPHVAGAIALLWSQNPTKTASQITDAVMANTDNVLRGSTSQFGRINVGKAAEALGDTVTNTPAQSGTVTNPPPQSTQRTYSVQGIQNINDATSQATVQRFPIDVPDGVVISDLDVILNVSHTYVRDLRIVLIAPDGTSRTLINRRGGSTDNVQVTLSDEATVGVASLSTLRGTVRPEQSLSAFDGKNAKGRWILQITDFERGDVGRLLTGQLVITTTSPITPASTASTTGTGTGFSLTNSVERELANARDLALLEVARWLESSRSFRLNSEAFESSQRSDVPATQPEGESSSRNNGSTFSGALRQLRTRLFSR